VSFGGDLDAGLGDGDGLLLHRLVDRHLWFRRGCGSGARKTSVEYATRCVQDDTECVQDASRHYECVQDANECAQDGPDP